MGATNSVPSRYFSPIKPLLRNSNSDEATTVATPYFVLVIRPPRSLVLIFSDAQIQSIFSSRLRKECKFGPTNPGSADGRLMNDGTFEFTLKLPIFHISNGANLKCAQILCRLLADLHTHGWKLVASSDLCRTAPRSTLFFRRQQRDLVDAATTLIGISVGSSDVIRLIDMPDQLSAGLTAAIESETDLGSRVKVIGQEIGGNSSAGVEGRTRRFIELMRSEGDDQRLLLTKILLKMYAHLHENGYRFYGIVNVEGGADLVLFEKTAIPAALQRTAEQFFAIDLVENNHLRVVNAPPRFRQPLLMCINHHWPQGMSNSQNSEPDIDTYTLNSQPWSSGSTPLPDGSFRKGPGQIEEALRARRFLSAMFEILADKQCRLVSSVQLDRVNGGTSTFVFSVPSALVDFGLPASRIHRNAWCLSPMSTSSVFLVNAFFLHLGSFQRLKDEIRYLLTHRWPRTLGQGGEDSGFRHYRLNGHPWHSSPYQPILTRFRRAVDDHGPNEDLHARALMCAILVVMESRGHDLVCAASVTRKRTNDADAQVKADCDAWFWVETEASSRRPVATAAQSIARSLLGAPSAPTRPASAPVSPILPTAPSANGLRPSAPGSPELEYDESNPPPYPVEAPPPAYKSVTKGAQFSSWRHSARYYGAVEKAAVPGLPLGATSSREHWRLQSESE